MFEFSVSKDIKSMLHRRGGGNREGSEVHLCLTLIVKELKISVE
jgi:hypothetical protein